MRIIIIRATNQYPHFCTPPILIRQGPVNEGRGWVLQSNKICCKVHVTCRLTPALATIPLLLPVAGAGAVPGPAQLTAPGHWTPQEVSAAISRSFVGDNYEGGCEIIASQRWSTILSQNLFFAIKMILIFNICDCSQVLS